MHEALKRSLLGSIGPARRYLMGVGTPGDLLRAIVRESICSTACFDAQRAQWAGDHPKWPALIKQAKYKIDAAPVDEACGCPCCREVISRAYLPAPFLAGEILVPGFLRQHNLWLYGELVRKARERPSSPASSQLRPRLA